MNAVVRQESETFDCVESPSYEDYRLADYNTIGCGASQLTKLYFISYTLFVTLFFLNLFIAIILQTFNSNY